MLVIVTGEIDISVGSLMGLSAAVMGLMVSRATNGTCRCGPGCLQR